MLLQVYLCPNCTYEEFDELKMLNGLSLAKTYIRNWRVSNGHYPSSKKDTEQIFIDMLKTRVKYTVYDVKDSELTLPKPSPRYIALLKAETEKIRTATSNQYFKFDEGDGVKTFNKREYLLEQPKSRLYTVCKAHGMKKYKKLALYSLVSAILKLGDIDNIIYDLIITDRHYIADEDLEVLRVRRLKSLSALNNI